MKNLQQKMFKEFASGNLNDKVNQANKEYLNTIHDREVYPTDEAVEKLQVFDEELQNNSISGEEVLDRLIEFGAPATVAQLGGRYFGFVNGNAVPAGLAAKSLATYWDQNSAMHVLSPITSKLETVAESWLKDLFGFPDSTAAGFVSGTSAANLCGLAAGRFRILQRAGWDVNENGLNRSPKIRIVAGKDAHSTVLKAIGILGLGKANIEWVEVDEQGRMIIDSLPELDEMTLLILQAGNVNSGSFDPFYEICQKANKANAWVHIDGAFGLWAQAANELRYLTKGIELADSWAVDGHKTLNTPYDSGIVLCKDKDALVSALHMTGSYIVVSKERDGMFYTPEMSRRARGIELWATMKFLGKNGIDEMVTGLHHRAKQFATEINEIDGFHVPNEVVFNQVLVQCESDEITAKTMDLIQQYRDCWVGGAMWKGKKVIRVSVCSWATTEEDISISVISFEKALREVQSLESI